MQTVHHETSTNSPPLHPFMGLQKSSPVPQQPPSGSSQNPQPSEEAQNLCTKKPSNGQSNRGKWHFYFLNNTPFQRKDNEMRVYNW